MAAENTLGEKYKISVFLLQALPPIVKHIREPSLNVLSGRLARKTSSATRIKATKFASIAIVAAAWVAWNQSEAKSDFSCHECVVAWAVRGGLNGVLFLREMRINCLASFMEIFEFHVSPFPRRATRQNEKPHQRCGCRAGSAHKSVNTFSFFLKC